jgi:Putative auto-transporter adhesin, head GIN domain
MAVTTAPTPVPQQPRRHSHRLTVTLLVSALALLGILIVLLVRGNGTTTNISVGVLGSGIAAAETRPLPAFHSIDLAGSNTMTIHVGPEQSVAVHADDNLIDVVTTVVSGGTLLVDNVGSFTTKAPMRVEITVPALDSVSLTGSGTIDVTGVDSKSFTADLTGSGTISAAGTAGRLDARLSGAGDCRLAQLAAREVTARLEGAGRLTVSASRSLDASVAGTGVIAYTGNPARVTTTVTGTGAIHEQ